MKYIAEDYQDMIKLANMLVDGQITSEEYWEATDRRAKRVIEEELKQRSARRKAPDNSWIQMETIGKPLWRRFKEKYGRVSSK